MALSLYKDLVYFPPPAEYLLQVGSTEYSQEVGSTKNSQEVCSTEYSQEVGSTKNSQEVCSTEYSPVQVILHWLNTFRQIQSRSKLFCNYNTDDLRTILHAGKRPKVIPTFFMFIIIYYLLLYLPNLVSISDWWCDWDVDGKVDGVSQGIVSYSKELNWVGPVDNTPSTNYVH